MRVSNSMMKIELGTVRFAFVPHSVAFQLHTHTLVRHAKWCASLINSITCAIHVASGSSVVLTSKRFLNVLPEIFIADSGERQRLNLRCENRRESFGTVLEKITHERFKTHDDPDVHSTSLGIEVHAPRFPPTLERFLGILNRVLLCFRPEPKLFPRYHHWVKRSYNQVSWRDSPPLQKQLD